MLFKCEALESDRPEFKFQLHHLQLGASYSYLGLYVLIYERRGAAGGTVGPTSESCCED